MLVFVVEFLRLAYRREGAIVFGTKIVSGDFMP